MITCIMFWLAAGESGVETCLCHSMCVGKVAAEGHQKPTGSNMCLFKFPVLLEGIPEVLPDVMLLWC